MTEETVGGQAHFIGQGNYQKISLLTYPRAGNFICPSEARLRALEECSLPKAPMQWVTSHMLTIRES